MSSKEEFLEELKKRDFVPVETNRIANVLMLDFTIGKSSIYQYVIGLTIERESSIYHYHYDLKRRLGVNSGEFPFVNFRFDFNMKETAKEILLEISKIYNLSIDTDRILQIVQKPASYAHADYFHIIISKIAIPILS